jgi:hypothetical protein
MAARKIDRAVAVEHEQQKIPASEANHRPGKCKLAFAFARLLDHLISSLTVHFRTEKAFSAGKG